MLAWSRVSITIHFSENTMSKITLDAQLRNDLGKGASRRLRREEKVLAIVYGGKSAPVAISLENKNVNKAAENEAFYSSIISLNIGGENVDVLVKDMQRHAFRPLVTHIDFLRVDASHTIQTLVPLHFINEETAKGVKDEGGIINHQMNEVEISCLPAALPSFIDVDVANVALGETLHLSSLVLPAGVTLVELAKGEDHDHAVVTIIAPKGTVAAEDTAE
jgi:large subunit ribosomal protein L25